MSTVENITAAVSDHLDRRWLVWAVGIVALLAGIVIGYVLPGGGAADVRSSVTGVGVTAPIQGGR